MTDDNVDKPSTASNYTLRRITDTELPAYYDLVYTAFQRKQNPPTKQYFINQHTYDPYNDINSIVVVQCDNTFVSTSRIVQRNLFINNTVLSIHGIADVCTLSEYAGHSFAQQCILCNETHYTKQHNIALCVLHTSQLPLQSYYSNKLGYITVPRHYINTNLNNINDTLLSPTLKQYQSTVSAMMSTLSATDLNTDKYITELNDMYNEFVQRNFNGSIQRTVQYWQSYIHTKITSSQSHTYPIRIDVFKIMANKLGAYMISQIRVVDNIATLYVIEYAQQCNMNITSMMAQVLCITFIQRAVSSITQQYSDININIALPLVKLVCPDLYVDKKSITVDNGMMYKVMQYTDEHTHKSSNDNNVKSTLLIVTFSFEQFQQQCQNKPVNAQQLIDMLLHDATNKHFVSNLDSF